MALFHYLFLSNGSWAGLHWISSEYYALCLLQRSLTSLRSGQRQSVIASRFPTLVSEIRWELQPDSGLMYGDQTADFGESSVNTILRFDWFFNTCFPATRMTESRGRCSSPLMPVDQRRPSVSSSWRLILQSDWLIMRCLLSYASVACVAPVSIYLAASPDTRRGVNSTKLYRSAYVLLIRRFRVMLTLRYTSRFTNDDMPRPTISLEHQRMPLSEPLLYTPLFPAPLFLIFFFDYLALYI